jgi:hypothetical protein
MRIIPPLAQVATKAGMRETDKQTQKKKGLRVIEVLGDSTSGEGPAGSLDCYYTAVRSTPLEYYSSTDFFENKVLRLVMTLRILDSSIESF